MSKNWREKYERRSVYLMQFERNKLKEWKNYKNHWQAEYQHTLKRKKRKKEKLCRARDSNLAPLVYEVSALPIEPSLQMET